LIYLLGQESPVENTPEQVASKPVKGSLAHWRIPLILLIGAVLALVIYLSPWFFIQEEKRPSYPTLKVGGTSVVSIIVENRWRKAYREEKEIDLVYTSTGSTKGVKQMADAEFAVAFTHAPMSEEQRQKARDKGGDVVHLPVLLCGVAAVYNVKELKGKPALNLTGAVLADIFLGKIKKWNDPALKKLNPAADLPATEIKVVHRGDSSGTTLIFTNYLAAVSPAWRDKVGPGRSEVKWPTGVGVSRNLGVTQEVFKTEGAIGYVDRLFTSFEEMKLSAAAIQNKDGTAYVAAEPAHMTAAVQGMFADIGDDLTFDPANRSGKASYPITGVIYAICYRKQPEDKRQTILDFLKWATHEGQKFANPMRYATLPPELVHRVEQKLKTLESAS
jgi:phosphate transport system substrate-binding protein